MLEWRPRLFHQSTQAIVANSTSLMPLTAPLMKGPGRMHSALKSPTIDSIRALS